MPSLIPATSRGRLIAVVVAAALLTAAILSVAFLPGEDGEVDRVVHSTQFNVDRGTLDGASLAAGLQWTVRGGLFSVEDGAAIGSASGEDAAIALVDPPLPADQITVTFAHVETGSGLAFRVVDDQNYWAVVAAPPFGTWNITKTVAGRTTFVANTGNNLHADNTALRIRLTASQINVDVDGRPSMRIADVQFGGTPSAGLLAGPGDDNRTRWASFSLTLGS